MNNRADRNPMITAHMATFIFARRKARILSGLAAAGRLPTKEDA